MEFVGKQRSTPARKNPGVANGQTTSTSSCGIDQRRWLVPHVHAYPEPRLLWLLQHTRDSQLLPGAKEGGCEQAYLVSAEPLRPEGVVRRPGT